MHALHSILVHLDTPNGETDEMISEARCIAEERTEAFADNVFDWRETDTAGRWADEYEPNVILGKDNLDRLLKEIKDAEEDQKNEMERLKEAMHFQTIDQMFDDYYQHPGSAWQLKQLAKLLYGEYDFDSRYFDTYDYTARITPETYTKIKKSPSEWALVFFDYHY